MKLMMWKLLAGLVLLTLFMPAASAIDTMRVMVYCDNLGATPDCGASARQDSTADCPLAIGPCAYAGTGGVGVGAVVTFPDRFDPITACEHPQDCYGWVVSPDLLEGPCRLMIEYERPGTNMELPITCPDKAS